MVRGKIFNKIIRYSFRINIYFFQVKFTSLSNVYYSVEKFKSVAFYFNKTKSHFSKKQSSVEIQYHAEPVKVNSSKCDNAQRVIFVITFSHLLINLSLNFSICVSTNLYILIENIADRDGRYCFSRIPYSIISREITGDVSLASAM